MIRGTVSEHFLYVCIAPCLALHMYITQSSQKPERGLCDFPHFFAFTGRKLEISHPLTKYLEKHEIVLWESGREGEGPNRWCGVAGQVALRAHLR